MPLYYQQLRGLNTIDTGLLLGPQGIGMAFVMPFVGRLTDRIGGGPLVVFGVLLSALATIPLGLVGAHTSYRLALGGAGLPRRRHRLRLHAGVRRRVRGARRAPSCRTPRRSST